MPVKKFLTSVMSSCLLYIGQMASQNQDACSVMISTACTTMLHNNKIFIPGLSESTISKRGGRFRLLPLASQHSMILAPKYLSNPWKFSSLVQAADKAHPCPSAAAVKLI